MGDKRCSGGGGRLVSARMVARHATGSRGAAL